MKYLVLTFILLTTDLVFAEAFQRTAVLNLNLPVFNHRILNEDFKLTKRDCGVRLHGVSVKLSSRSAIKGKRHLELKIEGGMVDTITHDFSATENSFTFVPTKKPAYCKGAAANFETLSIHNPSSAVSSDLIIEQMTAYFER